MSNPHTQAKAMHRYINEQLLSINKKGINKTILVRSAAIRFAVSIGSIESFIHKFYVIPNDVSYNEKKDLLLPGEKE